MIHFLNDEFATISLAASFEQVLKGIIKRERPSYLVQTKKTWSICFECFSFPSGHTLRTAYLAVYAFNSRVFHKTLPTFYFAIRQSWTISLFLITSPFAVGFARITKGRHYLFDVVAGGVLGFMLGYAVEIFICVNYPNWFGTLKLLSRVNIAIQFLILRIHKAFKQLKLSNAFYAFAFFYLFYLAVLCGLSYPDLLFT